MIEEIRRFILVANNGNLTKTAEKIFITQSALSQSLQRLEKNLGTKLFHHKGKTLQITTDGLAILEIGTKILDLWEKAKDPNIRLSHQTRYTIGAFDNAAIRLGKYFLNNKTQDTFNLELVIGPSEKLLSQLQLGVLDLAICVVDKKNSLAKELVLIKTFREKLIPVSSQNFKQPFEKIPFVLYNHGSHTREHINSVFMKNGIIPNVFAESTSVTFMKELAILGCGIALLPENFVKTEIKQGILKKQKLPLQFGREYGIYTNKTAPLQKDHIIVKDLIKNLTE